MELRAVVGRNIKRLRVEKGLQQDALAHDAAYKFLGLVSPGGAGVTGLVSIAGTLALGAYRISGLVGYAQSSGA